MDKIDYTLFDLIDRDRLQAIQDAFAEANQVAATITDTLGFPLTKPSNHCRVCTLVRATEKGLARCMYSGQELGKRAASTTQPIFQHCLSCGFVDAAAPIIVEGKHIANWLIGQYYIGDVDETRIRDYAAEIDADDQEMLTAFRTMPKISEERFLRVLGFLGIMANEISRLGYQNLLLQRQQQELKKVQAELEEHQSTLEKTVQLRTEELHRLNFSLAQQLREKAASERRQARLLRAIENLAEAIVITDSIGDIIFVNPAFTKITGYSSEEVMGRNPRLLKSGVQDQEFYRLFWQELLEKGRWAGRLVNRRKDGSLYTEESTISSVRGEGGELTSFVSVKRDITKELDMERQLIQSAKLESIGTLAAGMAHEINTPVQYLASNLEFLADSFSDLKGLIDELASLAQQRDGEGVSDLFNRHDWDYLQEEVPKALSQSRSGIGQVSSIVMAMKEFAHPGSKQKSPTNLNRLVETALTVSRNEWKHLAQVEKHLAENLPPVPCLSDQVSQVLLNLIVNAVHAMAEKAARSGDADYRGLLRLETSASETAVRVAIRDNGTGIPEKIRTQIFDPFFTTKAVGKGTGQGLAIAYDIIVGKHRGELSCRSETGAWTEFVISLPLSEVEDA